MQLLKLKKKVSVAFIKEKMQNAKDSSDFKRWQIIYFVSSYNVDAEYLSDITAYSKASIYSIVQQFNNSSDSNVSVVARGGRRRSLMSVEEEKSFMKTLENKALLGQILSYLDIKKMVEKKVDKSVSDDYIWDLFKRNGWTKHSPRPHHPKKDKAKQEEFKKNSKTIWLPLKMILQTI